MAAGHHNGFNPFRDSHGRFSPVAGANATVSAINTPGPKGAGAMNDALRAASGRATGGGSGGDGGGSGGGGGSSFSTAATAAIGQTEAKNATFSAKTTAELDAIAVSHNVEGGWQKGMQASYDGLNGAAFSTLSQASAAAPKAHVDTLVQAYKEAGFNPPSGATKADLVALMDKFDGIELGSKAEANLKSFAIATALKAGDQGAALTFADGRDGAGIGWEIQRQELGGKPNSPDGEMVAAWNAKPATPVAAPKAAAAAVVAAAGAGAKTAAHATPAVLAKVDAQRVAKGQALHPATNAKLNDIMQTNDWGGTMHASYDGLNGAAFSVLSQSRGQATPEVVKVLIDAYKETGFDPPANASHADLLAYMDSYKGVPFGSAAEANRTSYGIALALKAGNQGLAQTLSDGREGAGVGWDYQRQELGADLEAENIALYGTA